MASIDILFFWHKALYRYGGPIIIATGTISCILGLLVFTQKHLRKNTCSIYFAGVNASNLFFLYSLVLVLTLAIGFNIDLASYSSTSCRIVIYVTYLVDSLTPFYLILASIDRVLVTSPNAQTRQRSTRHCAWISLVSGTIFWMSFHIPALILTDILPAGPDIFLCLPQPGYYTDFVGYYLLLIKGILFPLLMTIFCIWTVKNIRDVRLRRVMPSSNNPLRPAAMNRGSLNSRDRHFAFMLAINLSIHILFTLPLSISTMYIQVQQSTAISFEQNQISQFIRIIFIFVSYIPHCLDFYENMLISKTFRKEVKRLMTTLTHGR